MNATKRDEFCKKIAIEQLLLEPEHLRTRLSDHLDFKVMFTPGVYEALKSAYTAGYSACVERTEQLLRGVYEQE